MTAQPVQRRAAVRVLIMVVLVAGNIAMALALSRRSLQIDPTAPRPERTCSHDTTAGNNVPHDDCLDRVSPPVATGQSDNPNQGGKPSKEELSKLKANMPSDEEISELLAKADEKVSTFEKAVTSAKPHLDKFDTNQATNYLNAASTAHQLIQATKKNGPSAYRLIGVLATLDDLSVDAANGSAYLLAADEQQVLKGNAPDMHTQGAVIALITAGTACNEFLN